MRTERCRQPAPMSILVPVLVTMLAVAGLLAAPPAAAESYIVTMNDGAVFESRYQPEEASWDPAVVMLLTEYGNWIALHRSDIADVTTDVESRGFGKVIDTNTISLGVLANDAIPPEEQPEPDSFQQLQQFLTQQNQQSQDYSVNQFAEPGELTGGLPVGYSQQQSAPILVNQPQ